MDAGGTMSRLDELIAELCPDGVEYKRLGEVAECCAGATPKTGVAKYWENGTIPWMSSGEVNKGIIFDTDVKITELAYESCSTKLVPANTVVVALAGQGKTRGKVARTRIELCTNQSLCSIIPHPILDSDYLYFYLDSQYRQLRAVSTGDGSRGGLNLKMIREYKIPLPPLEVQREIVRILDAYSERVAELTDRLAAELDARKKQMDYYHNSLFSFGEAVTRKPLGDLFPFIRNGFVGIVTPYFTDEEHGVRYLEGTNIHNGDISDDEILYVNREFHERHLRTELKADDILMVQSGHVGECAVVGEKYEGANCHALIVMSNGGECDSRFMTYYFYSLEGKKKLRKITTGETVKHILASAMKKYVVPAPPLSEQKRIVGVLDKLYAAHNKCVEELTAEIEARRKQYEHYRDQLLTFKEKTA